MPSNPGSLKSFWSTTDGSLKLYWGDVIDVLRRLPEQSVQTVITSPPYWNLRSYLDDGHGSKHLEIGSERTPDLFVAKMVEVFREVRRVLRDDGTVWLNLGDSYASGEIGRKDKREGKRFADLSTGKGGEANGKESGIGRRIVKSVTNLPSGNLVGIPWRIALALQADGWVLRQDIIWHKPSPMPESVKNRCTKAHEYVFLLVKQSGYFYDNEAVKENSIDPESLNGRKSRDDDKFVKAGIKAEYRDGFSEIPEGKLYLTRNKRSVWTISSQGYEGAHFAVFPPKLVEPCLLAGTSAYGCCVKCGAPWKRVTEEEKLKRSRPNDYVKYADTSNEKKQQTPGKTPQGGWDKLRAEDTASRKSGVNSCSNSVAGVAVKTVGWEPTCKCGIEEVKPCVVCDPFCGSGTTLEVALSHGRYGVGIDLSEKYLSQNAIPRLEGALMTRPNLVHLAGRTAEKVEIGESVGEEGGADES